jgi:hypothetical protein
MGNSITNHYGIGSSVPFADIDGTNSKAARACGADLHSSALISRHVGNFDLAQYFADVRLAALQSGKRTALTTFSARSSCTVACQ